MIGFNTLSVPGPTNMPFRVRAAMEVALEDHRAPDFPNFTLPLLEDLKKVFGTRSGRVAVFPSSGTGGWEAAITNTLSPGDRVLVPVLGQFSHLWADLCRRHRLDVEAIEVEWGCGAPVEEIAQRLEADTSRRIKAVLVCHNETTTGVTSDIAAVRGALDAARHPALLMVDGVSSIASIDFWMDEWGVDLAVTGSQKGLMLPAGLALVAVGERALEAAATASCPRAFFDLTEMLAANAGGYFPYTPAATLLRGLRASLDMLLAEGLGKVAARHARIAEGVRAAVAAWNLPLCAKHPRWYSNTVSAVMVPEGFDSGAVVKLAYERYNLSLGLGLSKVAGRVFRIGHIGWMNELMAIQAIAGAEMAMRDAGIDVEPGSGVAAAEEYYRTSRTRMVRPLSAAAAA